EVLEVSESVRFQNLNGSRGFFIANRTPIRSQSRSLCRRSVDLTTFSGKPVNERRTKTDSPEGRTAKHRHGADGRYADRWSAWTPHNPVSTFEGSGSAGCRALQAPLFMASLRALDCF